MKLQQNILNRVRKVEEKRGIVYAKTDGKLYKTLKVFYIIFLVYTFIINALFVLSNFMVYYGTDSFKGLKKPIITVICGTFCFIASLFVLRFKDKIWANIATLILNLLPSLLTVLVYANLMEDSLGLFGYKYSFYWRHSVPLALIAVFAIWLSVLALRANIKTKKQYKKITETLYNQYHISEENEQLSEEEWQEFIENYKF